MNVIHISCVAPPQTGGIGQSASEMVKRLQERGVEAMLIAPKLRGKMQEPDPMWVKRLSAPLRIGHAAVLAGVKSLIRDADVVHLHYPFFGTAESIAQDCLMMRKPLVMTFHMDATSDGIASSVFDTSLMGRLGAFRALRRMFVSFLDGVYQVTVQPAIIRASRKIFVSSFDYADHSSLGRFRKRHMDRVIELPFGVDHQRFSPVVGEAKMACRAAWGIPADVQVIGFVGGMDAAHAFKGVPDILNALSLLSPQVHALLVGDGAQRKLFEKQAKELGIEARCHFMGRIPDERLPDAYRAMDVLAFPSTNTAEAFGLVAIEAMACGIPVVASNLPGVRSVVADQVTGILVPPSNPVALADALKRVLEQASLRTGMSRAARERVLARYDWGKHVDELMKVYQEVAASPVTRNT